MRSAGDRPIAVFKLALEAGDGDGAEMPAVERVVPIVAQDEAIVFGNGDGAEIGGGLFLGEENSIFGAVVVFIKNIAGGRGLAEAQGGRPGGLAGQFHVVDIQVARFHFHPVAGQGDDAFNEVPHGMRSDHC